MELSLNRNIFKHWDSDLSEPCIVRKPGACIRISPVTHYDSGTIMNIGNLEDGFGERLITQYVFMRFTPSL